MKKVLIVSYWYPPVNAIGAVRVASFVRHLPSFGWVPYVVTVRPSGLVASDGSAPIDEGERVCRTPAADVNEVVRRFFKGSVRGSGVSRAEARGGLSPKRLALALYDEFLAYPDSVWPWYHLGRRQAVAFARAVKPDAILSSSPPVTAHSIAARLHAETGAPWVADLRDLWSQSVWNDWSPRQRNAAEKLECKTLKSASALCTVSEPLAAALRSLHHKPAFVVHNGYEPAEFVGPATLFDRFTILYTGMIYPGKREPTLLFGAVRALAKRGAIGPQDLRLLFYGPNHELTGALARKAGVEAFVECHARVSRELAIKLQRRAHALLQLEWNDERALGVFPGKFFEYLGAGRPIMAIGPKGGVIEQTLRRTGCGRVLSDESEIEAYLTEALIAHRGGRAAAVASNSAVLAEFTREAQARVLAGELSRLAGSRQ